MISNTCCSCLIGWVGWGLFNWHLLIQSDSLWPFVPRSTGSKGSQTCRAQSIWYKTLTLETFVLWENKEEPEERFCLCHRYTARTMFFRPVGIMMSCREHFIRFLFLIFSGLWVWMWNKRANTQRTQESCDTNRTKLFVCWWYEHYLHLAEFIICLTAHAHYNKCIFHTATLPLLAWIVWNHIFYRYM